MIIHPPAYNIALRPYYQWMTNGKQLNTADNRAAAYLLDYVENADPIAPSETWKALPFRQLYDAMSPFVAQSPVRNALEWLEADGLIESRHDPANKLNRTKQYRLNESEVQQRIDCWSISEGLKNAQPRIIQTVEREQAQAPQIMQNDGVEDMAKVRVRDSVLISNTPEKLNIGNDYKTTMRLLIPMLSVEVFPVTGKSPALKEVNGSSWEWSRKRLGRPGVQSATFHAWNVATGYGMVPIKGERLVFLDVDRETFDHELLAAIPRLATTYRQSRGTHSCYAIRLPAELDGRWEINDTDGEIASIRNHNSYQVGAGSLHPSGERYACNMQPPIELSDIEAKTLLDMFEARKASKGSRKPATTTTPARSNHIAIPDKMVKRAKRWGEKGITGALSKLNGTNKGAFNSQLYKTACRIAGLARYTGDSDEQLTDMLWSVCESAGYVRRDGRSTTSATIRSGLTAGKSIDILLPKEIRDAVAS